MTLIQKISKTLCVSLALGGAAYTISYATDPGSMEAINSASAELRNIIGIEISTPTEAQKAIMGCGEGGVLVSAVIPKHPAELAGVKVGDIIVKIGEHPVANHSEALTAMNGLDAGRYYPFEICRQEGTSSPQKLVINVLVEKVPEKAIGKIS